MQQVSNSNMHGGLRAQWRYALQHRSSLRQLLCSADAPYRCANEAQ